MDAPQDMIPAWVDGNLAPVDKLEVHRRGLRHKAVSVFITGPKGILLQRRAMGKYHTPGLWANTCCTHPHWEEGPEACAQRRLGDELGITGVALRHAGQVEYRADVGGGLVEHELVEIFVGRAPDGLAITPNATEVMATDWVTPAALTGRIAQTPAEFTPWLRIYLADHAGLIFG